MIGKALNVQCCITATGSCREATICAMWLYPRRLVLQGSTCSFPPLNLDINVAGVWQEIGDDFVSFWVVTDVSIIRDQLNLWTEVQSMCIVFWGVNSSGITCKSSLKWHAITAAIMLKGDKLPYQWVNGQGQRSFSTKLNQYPINVPRGGWDLKT